MRPRQPWPACLPAQAALDEQKLLEALERLNARVAALEKRNAELEQALDSERLSEREPELATRLKVLESQTLAMAKPAALAQQLDGIELSASLASVLQQAPAGLTEAGRRQTRLSYRGDIQFAAPAGEWADMKAKAFAHLRFGQGEGLALRPGYSSTPNTLAFQTGDDADASFAILAQAGLELDIPLPREGQPKTQRLSLTLGKLDPFVHFDANALADDESAKFMNNAFVHNPLLDSGGDIRADRFGFAPGAVLKWSDDANKGSERSVSVGLFGSGSGANLSGAPRRPLALVQFEQNLRWNYLSGSYRVYAWQQGQAEGWDGELRRHRGLGVSLNQQLGDNLAVFARWGRQSQGAVRFDRALVAGLEWQGNAWGRGADALGLALGSLRTAKGFAAVAAGLDDWGHAASGSEQLAELYYRWRLAPQLELSPDLQWLRQRGGDAAQRGDWVAGLRAKVSL